MAREVDHKGGGEVLSRLTWIIAQSLAMNLPLVNYRPCSHPGYFGLDLLSMQCARNGDMCTGSPGKLLAQSNCKI